MFEKFKQECYKIKNSKKAGDIFALLFFMLLFLAGAAFFTILMLQHFLKNKIFTDSNSHKIWLTIVNDGFKYFYVPLIVMAFSFWMIVIACAHLRVPKYIDTNIFRAFNNLRSFYIVTMRYASLAKLNHMSTPYHKETMKLLRIANKNGFVLQGSGALKLKYDDYYRDNNDLDFIPLSCESSTKNFANSLIDIKNLKYTKWLIEGDFHDKKIELYNLKLIPIDFVSKAKGINIPDEHWLLGMKYVQLFKLSRMYKTDRYQKEFNDKLVNTINDLMFLYSKTNRLSAETIATVVDTITISNAFASYYMSYTYQNIIKMHDASQHEEFLQMIKDFCQINHSYKEFQENIERWTKIIYENKTSAIIENSLYSILEHRLQFTSALINNNILLKYDPSDVTCQVNPQNLSKFAVENKPDKCKSIAAFMKNFNSTMTIIDFRYLILLELSKRVKEAKK
ncbi:MAG4530 family protein [Mycoplasmopsis adleri]|uniref:MAG4530 family protein n=1 Tax=Mycoplasmopsis adleri TaxID=51362 RepID=UPI0038732180